MKNLSVLGDNELIVSTPANVVEMNCGKSVSYTHLDVYKRQHTHTHTHYFGIMENYKLKPSNFVKHLTCCNGSVCFLLQYDILSHQTL